MAKRSLPRPGSRSDATRKAVLAAVARARRRGLAGEASKAAVVRIGRDLGTPFSGRSLNRYAGSAFRAAGPRRSVLRPSDTVARRADVVSYQRGVELGRVIHGSKDASKVARWQNAMRAYLRTGDPDALQSLSEAARTIDRGRTVLVNDPDELQALADAGIIDDFREEAGS